MGLFSFPFFFWCPGEVLLPGNMPEVWAVTRKVKSLHNRYDPTRPLYWNHFHTPADSCFDDLVSTNSLQMNGNWSTVREELTQRRSGSWSRHLRAESHSATNHPHNLKPPMSLPKPVASAMRQRYSGCFYGCIRSPWGKKKRTVCDDDWGNIST